MPFQCHLAHVSCHVCLFLSRRDAFTNRPSKQPKRRWRLRQRGDHGRTNTRTRQPGTVVCVCVPILRCCSVDHCQPFSLFSALWWWIWWLQWPYTVKRIHVLQRDPLSFPSLPHHHPRSITPPTSFTHIACSRSSDHSLFSYEVSQANAEKKPLIQLSSSKFLKTLGKRFFHLSAA